MWIRARVAEISLKNRQNAKIPIDSHSNENFICLFPPAGGRQPPNYLVPIPGVCSTLSQNFTPIAQSCVEICSTVQTNKQKNKQKANLISCQTLCYATLYGEIKRTTWFIATIVPNNSGSCSPSFLTVLIKLLRCSCNIFYSCLRTLN